VWHALLHPFSLPDLAQQRTSFGSGSCPEIPPRSRRPESLPVPRSSSGSNPWQVFHEIRELLAALVL
jgi:hypothetical protein